MERDLKRISGELKLSQESRERIRSQLSSCEKRSEDIPMKKSILKSRVPLLVAAIVTVMALTLTAGATVTRLFRNDIIVASVEDAAADAKANAPEGDGPTAVSIDTGPGGGAPTPLEEIIESERFKSSDWYSEDNINGGLSYGYGEWDDVEVLSNDPALRIRRVTQNSGAVKMEYTAENPANLVNALTDHVTLDLSWMGEHYDYVPDANMSYVISDEHGKYDSELFCALYAKPDESGGYFRVEVMRLANNTWARNYIVDGSYETACYYTSADGYEFLITIDNGRVWAECNTGHTQVMVYGAYLTCDEVEDILDHLSLSIQDEP